jgi:hypothetical protein
MFLTIGHLANLQTSSWRQYREKDKIETLSKFQLLQ